MVQIAYCWDEDGYLSHEEECTIDPLESAEAGRDVYVLPARACLQKPTEEPGKIARRVNGEWVQIENHKDKEGFIGRTPHTIDKYGPLPDGFSETSPPLTAGELFTKLRVLRDGRLSSTDKYLISDYPISEGDLALVKTYRAALRALPEQPGAPWDGGGDGTPWPAAPLATVKE